MAVSISGDGIISGITTLTTGNFITTESISAPTATFSGNVSVGGISTFSQSINAPTATFSGNVSVGGTLTYEDVTNIDSIGIITARSGVIISGVTTVSAGSTSSPAITPTGDNNTGIFFPFSDTIAFAEGGTEAARFTNDGIYCYNQPEPVSLPTNPYPLTVADLKNGIVILAGNAGAVTLPTGTLMEGGFSGIYTNMTFRWSIINNSAGACTLSGNTDHTYVGGTNLASSQATLFATRRTAANTFVTYRIG